MSTGLKREYLRNIRLRYHKSAKKQRSLILDEFCAVCKITRRKLMSERLEGIAQKRKQYTEHLRFVESKVADSIDAAESAEYIREKFVDFESGFNKATSAQKKRLFEKPSNRLLFPKTSWRFGSI